MLTDEQREKIQELNQYTRNILAELVKKIESKRESQSESTENDRGLFGDDY